MNATKKFPWWKSVLFEAWRNCWRKKDFIVWYSLSVLFCAYVLVYHNHICIILTEERKCWPCFLWTLRTNRWNTFSFFFVVIFHWTALLWVVESMKMIDECLILWFTQQNNEPLNDFSTHSVVFQRLMNAIWNDVHQFGGMTNEDFNVACCCTILYFVLFIIAVVSISFYSLYFIFHDDLICFCGRHYLSWWW